MGHFRRLAGFAATGIATMVIAASLPEALTPSMREEGAIETASALLLVLAALLTLALVPLWEWLHVSLIVLLLAEREFEVETLPEGSALRSAIDWIDTGALDDTRVVAVLGVFILAGLALFSLGHWRRSWRAGALAPRLFLLGCGFAVLSEIASLSAKHLSDRLGPDIPRRLEVFEEVGELWFCIALLGAVCLFLMYQRRMRRER